jgi:hypothetical protein
MVQWAQENVLYGQHGDVDHHGLFIYVDNGYPNSFHMMWTSYANQQVHNLTSILYAYSWILWIFIGGSRLYGRGDVGQSTLQGAQDCCHMVLFSRILCLNFNHVIIMKDFHNVLHIMVGQNPKKSNAKETTFYYFIWCDVIIYLCQKNIHHNILKI